MATNKTKKKIPPTEVKKEGPKKLVEPEPEKQKIHFLHILTLILALGVLISLAGSFYLMIYYESQLYSAREGFEESRELIRNESLILEKETLEFLKDYSIILTNIHVATEDLTLAKANIDYARSSANKTYNQLIDAHYIARSQINAAKQILSDTKDRIQILSSQTPDDFFLQDLSYREEQTQILANIANNLEDMISYSEREINELTYGSVEAAQGYLTSYQESQGYYDFNQESLIFLKKQIDEFWGQNWQLTLEE